MLRKFVSWALALGLALATFSPATAAEKKPIATVSIASINELLGNVNYVTELAGVGESGKMVSFFVGPYTQGIDKNKPIGVVVTSVGPGAPSGFVFAPVSDLKGFLEAIKTVAGEAKDGGNGVYELPTPEPIFIKQSGSFAFAARTAEELTDLPADPVALLGGTEKQYTIAVRANMQNIPEDLRKMAIDNLKAGAQGSLEQRPDEDAQAYAARKRMTENGLKQIEKLFTEADAVTIGLNVDRKSKNAYFDFGFTVKSGSKLAPEFAALANSKTSFGGFLSPTAAITGNLSIQMPANRDPQEIADGKAQLKAVRDSVLKQLEKDGGLDAEKKKLAEDVVNTVFDVLDKTLETGKLDAAASVQMSPTQLSVVAGGYVADSAPIDSVFKKLVDAIKGEADVSDIKLNAETVGSAHFHTFKVKVNDDKAEKVLGEKADVALGVGDKCFYIAVGKDSFASLKKCIADSASSGSAAVQPMQVTVALATVMKFMQTVNPNEPGVAAMADALGASGADKVKFSARAITNGELVRIEAEEGLIKAIGQAAQGRAGGAPGGRPARPARPLN